MMHALQGITTYYDINMFVKNDIIKSQNQVPPKGRQNENGWEETHKRKSNKMKKAVLT